MRYPISSLILVNFHVTGFLNTLLLLINGIGGDDTGAIGNNFLNSGFATMASNKDWSMFQHVGDKFTIYFLHQFSIQDNGADVRSMRTELFSVLLSKLK